MMETVSDSPSLRRWRRYLKYKPSGVEWLGEVPEGWEIVPLKRLLISNKGGVWGEDSYGNGTIILRSTEMTLSGSWQIKEPAYRKLTEKEFKSFLVKKGDLILTKSSGSKDHLGKTAEVTEEIEKLQCCYSNFMQRLRIKNNSASRFVYWHLNGICGREQLLFLGTTTTGLSNLTTEIIGDVLMPTPPILEQHAIAAFLDRETTRIDALIEKKERQIELLQEKRSALISHAVTKGLDPNAKMKDSGIEWLGMMPKGWEIKKVKWLTSKIGSGKTPKGGSEIYEESGILFIRSQNVHFIGLNLEDMVYISLEIDAEMASSQVKSRDILLNITGASLGRCTIVPENLPKANVNQHVCIVRPIIKRVQPEFLNHFLSSSLSQWQIFKSEEGVSREGLTFSQVGNLMVLIPPLNEQKKISQFIESQSNLNKILIDKIRLSINILNEYRSALISAAVTGKIDVRQEVVS